MEFDQFVSKGWGYEKIIVNGDLYCGKVLHIAKGRACSFHYHIKKTETFYINFGEILLHYNFGWNDDEELKMIKTRIEKVGEDLYLDAYCTKKILKKGDIFHIEPGMIHKMTAKEDSEIIEFSTKHYDDDSIRVIEGD